MRMLLYGIEMQNTIQEKIARAQDICRQRGKTLTRTRERVLQSLLESGCPLKAYDIAEGISGMKPMSVYRILDFLAEMGLAHRIESLNAYAPCVETHCTHTDSQYLICEKCHNIEELHNHHIDDFIEKELKKKHFTSTYKTIEVHGVCGNCS